MNNQKDKIIEELTNWGQNITIVDNNFIIRPFVFQGWCGDCR